MEDLSKSMATFNIVRQKQTFTPLNETFKSHEQRLILQAVQALKPIWLQDNGLEVIGLCPRWLIEPYNDRQMAVIERNHHFSLLDSKGYNKTIDKDKKIFNTLDRVPITETSVTLQSLWQTTQQQAQSGPEVAALEGFRGGLMGFLGYDWAAAQHLPADERTAQSTLPKTQVFPPLTIGFYDIFLRKLNNQWVLFGPDEADLQIVYQAIERLINEANKEPLARKTVTKPVNLLQCPFKARWTMAQYRQAFEAVRQYLAAGDCYQVNLTQAFDAVLTETLPAQAPLLQALLPLVALTRAPFAGYMTVGSDAELLSCSPEVFLEFNARREVMTQPIKGTAPRFNDNAQDLASKQYLQHSVKDHCENVMIVDLLRNDLGQWAQTGSVHVPELFKIKAFAQVYHLVSEIRATLRPEVSPLTLLLAASPGGSITGAPKIRAMQIITELEAGPRGAYCGSLGYLNVDDTGRFNILIRTVQRQQQHLTVWAGGGITSSSEVAQEYQECLDKVGALLQALEQITVS